MEIKSVYVVSDGGIHAVTHWERQNKPTLNGGAWIYSREPILLTNFKGAAWTHLIPRHRGTKATYIKFDNGEVVII